MVKHGKPAAIVKAESLARFARHSGAPRSEFALAITLGEAYELLDDLVAQHPDNLVLKSDVIEAKVAADPFRVLGQFRLNGFDLVRLEELH